ncbi:MAG: hypothetical protein LBC89_01400 [Bacteroidales bacterium]|jgi:lipopolysaccharide biosynthesis glycosyltransferase|nr:hypothetical protein [Bacteroidales bacterium]
MKYIYVLTSSENDFYYEQFFLSITSMRLYNPNAEIIVLIDKKTKEGLIGKRSGYEPLTSEITVIQVPEEFSQKEASRYIKTSIPRYISGDFLFVDCDTIITEKLHGDFPAEIIIGAVLDTHVPLSRHHLRHHFQKEDKQLNFVSSLKTDVRYNGGLLFCNNRPETYNFFERWHRLWQESRKKGNSQDMPSLNQANYELHNIITEIDGEWNCQISHNGIAYLPHAKIIHYFATSLISFDPPYILASKTTLQSIKNSGVISDEIKILLEKPKSAFAAQSRIIADGTALNIIDSAYFSKLLWLRRHHPILFKKLNSIISKIRLKKR